MTVLNEPFSIGVAHPRVVNGASRCLPRSENLSWQTRSHQKISTKYQYWLYRTNGFVEGIELLYSRGTSGGSVGVRTTIESQLGLATRSRFAFAIDPSVASPTGRITADRWTTKRHEGPPRSEPNARTLDPTRTCRSERAIHPRGADVPPSRRGRPLTASPRPFGLGPEYRPTCPCPKNKLSFNYRISSLPDL